ncbi:MAG: hypothetical protein AAGF22_09410 [Pseudomonadota bacterium]
MLQTIVTSSYISVQGEFVKTMADGKIMIRVGRARYVGNPIGDVRPSQPNLALAN